VVGFVLTGTRNTRRIAAILHLRIPRDVSASMKDGK
jgi:hypothetical protein